MKKSEFTFLSADGIHRLHGVRWMPDSRKWPRPRGILQITHGMCEYIERYEEFAEFLCGQGFIVTGHDLLGHGRSAAIDEELGYFSYRHPCRTLLEDMRRLYLYTKRKFPGLPCYMLGHSMGSYLLRCYLARYDSIPDGAIIMGTGYVAPAAAALGIGLCYVMAWIRGWRF